MDSVDSLLKILNEHLLKYDSLTEEIMRSIIQYLRDELNPLYIKVNYENPNHIKQINKIQNIYSNINSGNPSDDTHNNPHNNIEFINVNSKTDIVPQCKIVLSTNRFKANFENLLVKKCNGLIIAIMEINNKLQAKPLVIPANEFSHNNKLSIVSDLYNKNKYTLYKIKDGTTVNMYYDYNYIELVLSGNTKIYKKGKWLFSSKNAPNLKSIVWRGYEYITIIEDILNKYNVNYDNLDKDTCYTFGFKHPAYHLFQQSDLWNGNNNGVYDAWLISSFSFRQNKYTESEIGLPLQKPEEKIKFNDILANVKNALHNYLSFTPNSIILPEANLGYILRADPNDSDNIPDIILESTLWNEIRHMLYQLPYIPNKALRARYEQNFKNIDYVVLDSYLDFRRRQLFIQLFPQFSKHFTRYNNIINKVVDEIYDRCYYRAIRRYDEIIKRENSRDINKMSKEDKIIINLVDKFENIVKMNYQIRVSRDKKRNFARSDKKTIRNIITSLRYVDIYYQLIHT